MYTYVRNVNGKCITYEVMLKTDGSVVATEEELNGSSTGSPNENIDAFKSNFRIVAKHHPELLPRAIKHVEEGNYNNELAYKEFVVLCREMIGKVIRNNQYEDIVFKEPEIKYEYETEKGLRGPIYDIILVKDGTLKAVINEKVYEKRKKKEYLPENIRFYRALNYVTTKYPELFVIIIQHISKGTFANNQEYQELKRWCQERYPKLYSYNNLGVERWVKLEENGYVSTGMSAYEGGLGYNPGDQGFWNNFLMVAKNCPGLFQATIYHIQQGEHAEDKCYISVVDACKKECDRIINEVTLGPTGKTEMNR